MPLLFHFYILHLYYAYYAYYVHLGIILLGIHVAY